MKRRTLLLSGVGAAGALIVGWSVLPPRSRLGDASTLPRVDGEVGLNGWIKIAADGTVLLAMARSEMGQGVHTALAMLVADELDVPLARVQPIEAGHDSLYGNVAAMLATLPLHPRDTEPGRETTTARAAHWMVSKLARELGISATGGSSSISDAWEPLRLAAATARAQLVAAAAGAWQVSASELMLKDGTVSHRGGKRAHFGELASLAAAAAPGDVKLKRPSQWTLIGRPEPRIDVPAKSNGSARYGIDMRPPGLLYAMVRHAPALGGEIGDELAHAAGQDAVAFRLAMLGDMPRHAAVLRLAAEKSGWGSPLPAGRARGVALHESFNGIVAQVAEVSLEGDTPRVHRVVCAIECGIVVNPGIVAQQMESSIVFGLTAALHGRIDIEGGVVKQRSFPDYPLLTLAATPRIETCIVPSTRAPGGAGEPGTPPIAPAVANALFALTGKRLRGLPLTLSG